jgi:hypothetical protein
MAFMTRKYANPFTLRIPSVVALDGFILPNDGRSVVWRIMVED